MRCDWAERSEAERSYHDTEWGNPVHDDRRLFERLTMHGAQAGLSLRTVLGKRDHYWRRFQAFDLAHIADLTDADLAELARDRGIIRHKLKLASIRGNARAALRIIDEHGSLDAYLWSFVDGAPVSAAAEPPGDIPLHTPLSDHMSASMRKRGFRFAGSAICQALMYSTGMAQGHVAACVRHPQHGLHDGSTPLTMP